MKVQEVLETAREAAIKIRQLEEQMEIRRQSVGVQGHNNYEVHAKSGILDPMRHVVDLIDWEEEVIDINDLRLPIDDAYEIMCGIEKISDSLMVEVTTRYYLQGESWSEIIDGYNVNGDRMAPLSERVEQLKGLSRSKQYDFCMKAMELAMERWERIGIAHLKEMGAS